MGRNERMRQARQNAGLSQEELARRIGASRQTVNMIERGDYNPSITLAHRYICASASVRRWGKRWTSCSGRSMKHHRRNNEHRKAQEDQRRQMSAEGRRETRRARGMWKGTEGPSGL